MIIKTELVNYGICEHRNEIITKIICNFYQSKQSSLCKKCSGWQHIGDHMAAYFKAAKGKSPYRILNAAAQRPAKEKLAS
jgi:hypothetical protein